MARQPERKVEVYANRSKHTVELVLLREGSRVDSVEFTAEQAARHIKHVQAGIDQALGRNSGLILPDGVKVN